MKNSLLLIVAGLSFTTPALAQNWTSDYDMGALAVVGGTEASGTIRFDCQETGNGLARQGLLSVFVNPARGITATAGDFIFTIDGEHTTLPFVDYGDDGFIHSKTPESLDRLQALVNGLENGSEVVVTEANNEIARMGLEGAGEALFGVDQCLEM